MKPAALCLGILSIAATLGATEVRASVLEPSSGLASFWLDPVFGADGEIIDYADAAFLPFAIDSDRFKGRGEFNFDSGDRVEFSLSGKIDPLIEGNVSFVDSGAPTTLLVTIGALMTGIPNAFTWMLGGSVTAPIVGEPIAGALPGDFYFGGQINGVTLGTLGSGELVANGASTVFPSTSGSSNCLAIDPVNGCSLQILAMSVRGPGKGGNVVLSGSFSTEAVAAVPLPAGAGFLMGALAALALLRRRSIG